MVVKIGEHFESDIEVLENKDGQLIVKKTYNNHVPCIRFLNILLKKYYAPHAHEIMPVAMHEYIILKMLEPYRIAPRPLAIEKSSIYLSYEGNPITEHSTEITRQTYLWQARRILHTLRHLGIRHNDLLDRNVLLKDGTVKIIDFTLAEYGNIGIAEHLPDPNWARMNQDYKLLGYQNFFPEKLSAEMEQKSRQRYREIASTVYNYHNLGVGSYDASEKEKTPYGYGERYNFDRMAMMVMNYDFTNKNILDLGCNSGWFTFQASLLGAKQVVGIDYEIEGKMGQSIRYAKAFADYLQAPVKIIDQHLETVQYDWLAYSLGLNTFDATLIMSVLHHIKDKKALMQKIFCCTNEVVFYEDHEFWNEMYDDHGNLIPVQGDGHRYDWNKDLSWQQRITSLERHEKLVLDAFYNSWRRNTLLLDNYCKIRLLGFSEKRRPMLAMFK